MTEEAPLRTLIAGDHEFIRRSLAMLMSRRGHFLLVGEASTAAEVKEQADRLKPDLVILDVKLPDGSGIAASREIRARHPETRVLILTPYADELALVSAVVAGALGYLRKGVPAQEVIDALQMVRLGRPLVNPSLRRQVLERVRQAAQRGETVYLTPEEEGILQQVVEGKTDRDIASVLLLTEETVKTHINTILGKLEVIIKTQTASYLGELRKRRNART